eukprot:gnl/TRDRNA2_/TRDRNA2_162261_c1_seq2.p2 gnl/TRDRNA2_/TRDRNA2_162261_c1~~gnl/TRDRNA2_/TRDRNA2_162261_c1_seq2.p2  ORF type:complete len:117 (-),score=19.12 gnl/TRDRNA2_/TRDRNA2_162261_c1_seq2:34-384(-)
MPIITNTLAARLDLRGRLRLGFRDGAWLHDFEAAVGSWRPLSCGRHVQYDKPIRNQSAMANAKEKKQRQDEDGLRLKLKPELGQVQRQVNTAVQWMSRNTKTICNTGAERAHISSS